LYKKNLEEWKCKAKAGLGFNTRTELDLGHLLYFGELARDLHNAEIARSVAAYEIMRLKALPTASSQALKFNDEPQDAEGLEDEAEQAIAMLDASNVNAWLHCLEEESSAEQRPEVEPDDWDVRSLQFGENCIGIAEGWIKIRLNRWNGIRDED
jgi:hypothetical protein